MDSKILLSKQAELELENKFLCVQDGCRLLIGEGSSCIAGQQPGDKNSAVGVGMGDTIMPEHPKAFIRLVEREETKLMEFPLCYKPSQNK